MYLTPRTNITNRSLSFSGGHSKMERRSFVLPAIVRACVLSLCLRHIIASNADKGVIIIYINTYGRLNGGRLSPRGSGG